MQGMNRNPPRNSPGRFGEFTTERIMPFVGNPDPIDRAKDDWVARPQQHDAAATQREFIEPLHRIIGHGRAEWWRGIDIKGGDSHPLSEQRSRKHNDDEAGARLDTEGIHRLP